MGRGKYVSTQTSDQNTDNIETQEKIEPTGKTGVKLVLLLLFYTIVTVLGFLTRVRMSGQSFVLGDFGVFSSVVKMVVVTIAVQWSSIVGVLGLVMTPFRKSIGVFYSYYTGFTAFVGLLLGIAWILGT